MEKLHKPSTDIEDQLASEYVRRHEEYFQELFYFISERKKCKDIKYIGMNRNQANGNTY